IDFFQAKQSDVKLLLREEEEDCDYANADSVAGEPPVGAGSSLCQLVHADLLLYCIRARYRTAAARLYRQMQQQWHQSVMTRLRNLTWFLCLPARLSPKACLLGVELIDSDVKLFGDSCPSDSLTDLRHLLARCHLMLLLDSSADNFPELMTRLNRLYPPDTDLPRSNSGKSREQRFRQSFLWLFLASGRAHKFLADTWRKGEARRTALAIETAIANCLRRLPPSALFDPPEGGRSFSARQRVADFQLLQDDILAYLVDLSASQAVLPDGLCLTACSADTHLTDDDSELTPQVDEATSECVG
uniref:Mab-21 domain-containing protein n=1 Tax=Macrostomum lignano TaxID=282301 RepID=A0A1I8FWG4_9PLAT